MEWCDFEVGKKLPTKIHSCYYLALEIFYKKLSPHDENTYNRAWWSVFAVVKHMKIEK